MGSVRQLYIQPMRGHEAITYIARLRAQLPPGAGQAKLSGAGGWLRPRESRISPFLSALGRDLGWLAPASCGYEAAEWPDNTRSTRRAGWAGAEAWV